MEGHQHNQGVEKSTDFFPVEHPVEPTDEDRPVKCPMPESSVINVSIYAIYRLAIYLFCGVKTRFCMVKKNNAASLLMFALSQ